MIAGEKKTELTVENILSKVSEYDIYRYYFPGSFSINKATKSPMPGRKDDTPSFKINAKNGFLYHIDFGDSRFRGGCIDFVMQLEGLSYHGALLKIDKDLGLGIADSSKSGDYKQIISQYTQPEIVEKRPAIIQCKVRRFLSSELAWWGEFHITPDELKDENIYPIKEAYLDGKRVGLGKNELVYGYLYENKYWKVYRPERPPKDGKWMSNCPIDLMDGLQDIKTCKKAIVTKAKKDKIVLKKFLKETCSVQNESLVALNEDSILYLKENVEVVYINYDADAPGKKNSWSVTTEFGFKHVNVPDKYVKQGIKDFADMGKQLGLQAIEEHLKKKGII